MARGWESKDIESQIEASIQARNRSVPQRTAEEIQRERERESFELQRARVLSDLKSAVHPGYREILQRSLTFLDEKLAALTTPERSD
jgi:hypothetical protein